MAGDLETTDEPQNYATSKLRDFVSQRLMSLPIRTRVLGSGHKHLRRFRTLSSSGFLLGTTRRVRTRGRRAQIIIASPRSASNTLLKMCASQTKMPKRIVSPKTESGFGHFSVDERKFPIFGGFIWYQHLWPTERNKRLVHRMSRSTLIVTWRNVFDWVVSMAEWMLRSGRTPWGIEADGIVASECFAVESTDFARAIEYVIQFELPMYIRFLNGWQEFSKSHRSVQFISFSEIIESDGSQLRRILNQAGLLVSGPCAMNEHFAANLNIGLPGRGKNILSKTQIERVEQMCKSSPVGWILAD